MARPLLDMSTSQADLRIAFRLCVKHPRDNEARHVRFFVPDVDAKPHKDWGVVTAWKTCSNAIARNRAIVVLAGNGNECYYDLKSYMQVVVITWTMNHLSNPTNQICGTLFNWYGINERKEVALLACKWHGRSMETHMHPLCRRFVAVCTPASVFHLIKKSKTWKEV